MTSSIQPRCEECHAFYDWDIKHICQPTIHQLSFADYLVEKYAYPFITLEDLEEKQDIVAGWKK